MATSPINQADEYTETKIPLAPHFLRRNLTIAGISVVGLVLSLAMILLFRRLVGLWLVAILICGVMLPTEIVFWLRHRKHQLFLNADSMRITRHDETVELSWAEIDAVYFDVRSNTLMLHRPAGDIYLPIGQLAEPQKLRADIEAVRPQGESYVLVGSKRNLFIPNERRWRGETIRHDMQIYLAAQLWTRQIPVRERWFWPAWSSRALFTRRDKNGSGAKRVRLLLV